MCLFKVQMLMKCIFLERSKLADSFYRLEHQEEDLINKKVESLLVRLQRVSDARHLDDYSINKSLCAKLRV
ncbi:hypothetical protein Hanom_Chr12g01160721 [Helianthus anomalus]